MKNRKLRQRQGKKWELEESYARKGNFDTLNFFSYLEKLLDTPKLVFFRIFTTSDN